ncbi:hypothetical protein MOQ72_10530 [Saccharopolyspora sp. K220]|uniref:hypothetical protein n=1 Tax=Saccharopolyspora soli TaxID=2926618 RepID=UPI001F5A1C58|nr:hypothetical protein [Saccharopolyspora soli]MCI2417859.1 hypothetical protein [Saccharopolyspora soli]
MTDSQAWEKSDREQRRSTRFRIFVITVVVLMVSAIAVGAALLVDSAEFQWEVLSILRLLTAGVMLVLSGLCVNFLPNVVRAVWHLTPKSYEEILELLRPP